MLKIVLVHHTEGHFETLVSVYDTLAPQYEVSIWSNSLNRYGRLKLLDLMGAPLFEIGQEFDASIVITYDQPLTAQNCGERLLAQITSKPIIKILHRYKGHSNGDEVHLFPAAPNAFIPVSSGFVPDTPPRNRVQIRNFLVQGNVEARRNYKALFEISKESNIELTVVGKYVTDLPLPQDNIKFFYDLPEVEFRSVCQSSNFILPLIDPNGYGQYFTDRFSSSIQAGYSFGLPFVAHQRLFELYPIAGIPYQNTGDLRQAVELAMSAGAERYAQLEQELRACQEIAESGGLVG